MVLQRRAKSLGFSLLSLGKVLLQFDQSLHILNALILLILDGHELIKLLLHLSLLLARFSDFLELTFEEAQVSLFVRPKIPLRLEAGRMHLSLIRGG